MGFLDAMKAANVPSIATVESPDFVHGSLTVKDDQFAILTGNGKYEFVKSDISEFKHVCSGGTWSKFKITFKDGKCGIITAVVATDKQQGLSTAPIERFFGDLM